MNPDELLARSARNKAIWMAKKVKKAEVAQVTDGQVQSFKTIHETKPTKVAKRVKKTICPTEHQEQFTLMEWCAHHPIASLMFAIPNGGKRDRGTAIAMLREGARAGVPDTMLPVPRGHWHGLFVEMKRVKGSRVSDAQKWWHGQLSAQGYKVAVCCGAQEAIDLIKWYLEE